MSDGWIKVHRQIQDCEIWDNDEPYDYRSAWIYLLLMANHRDKDIMFNRKPVTIKRGQFLTSVRKLAEHFRWSNDKTLRYLRLLEKLKMIIKDSDSSRTLLTIVNYDIYQCDENTDRTPISTPTEQQQVTNKNIKNVRKKERNIIKDTSPVQIELPLNDGTMFSVTSNMVEEYKGLYPSVDVEQELRNMKGWCNGNPSKRKTKKGISRFINSWLARVQDKGGNNNSVKPKSNQFNSIEKTGYDFGALERMLGG